MSAGHITFPHYQPVVSESGARGQWAHVSLDQIRDLFPKVPFNAHCETPRHRNQHRRALVFHAVFWIDHTDTWVSCWQCFQDMLRPPPLEV